MPRVIFSFIVGVIGWVGIPIPPPSKGWATASGYVAPQQGLPPNSILPGCDTLRREAIINAIGKLVDAGYGNQGIALVVDPVLQRLIVVRDGFLARCYAVSTSKNGLGNANGSGRTPTGLHKVETKIGDGRPLGSIFRSRNVADGSLARIYSDGTDVPEDLVTTRILWLSGLEQGKNKGGEVDTYNRYIYIHGTPEEGLIGTPVSHGCVRMRNRDVIELFDLAPTGTLVYIIPQHLF